MEQVYIFDFGDKIKAGYSTNVEKRLRTIELSSGVKAKQIYSVKAGRKEEGLLHSWLKNRLEGEFFAFPFDQAKQILDDIALGKITMTPWEIEREQKKLLRPKGTAKTEAQKKAQRKYMEGIATIQIRTTSERRDAVKSHAEAQGESVNGFIKRAIDETMERDTEGGETT